MDAVKLHKTPRESNMEAMRAFSMLMVLMVHGAFYSNGGISVESILADPSGMWYYCFVEELAIVCVNCFILISGYFGINLRMKSVVNLLFIVFYWKIAIFIGQSCFTQHFSVSAFIGCLKFRVGDWFIIAYMGLMFFSPALNVFIEYGRKRAIISFLIIFLSLNCLSFHSDISDIFVFTNGYSIFSFITLYTLGRCYRKFWHNYPYFTKMSGACIYLGCAVLTSLIVVIYAEAMPAWFTSRIPVGSFFSYNWVLNIVSSFGVLVFFSKLKLKSKVINWFGASAFSVYLIHFNPAIRPFYTGACRWLFSVSWPWLWLPLLLVFICVVYAVCTIADQSRIWSYGMLSKSASHKKC